MAFQYFYFNLLPRPSLLFLSYMCGYTCILLLILPQSMESFTHTSFFNICIFLKYWKTKLVLAMKINVLYQIVFFIYQ